MTAREPVLPDWNQVLDAVPVRNVAVIEEPRGAEQLLLKLPLQQAWFMRPPLSWLLPISRERKFALDPLGAEVWHHCNGQNTTETIIAGFGARHRLGFHEARLAVGQFLGMLMARKLIALVGRKNPVEEHP